MKKETWIMLLGIILMIIMLLAGVILGAAEVAVEPAAEPAPEIPAEQRIKPLRARVLPLTEGQKREFANWQATYGYNDVTQSFYNIAVLLNIADQHGELINRNRDMLFMIMAADDPNSLASLAVLNNRMINMLIERNIKLKKRVRELEEPGARDSKMQELIMRIEALENKKPNLIGEDHGEGKDVSGVAGRRGTTGDQAEPEDGRVAGGDSQGDQPAGSSETP